MTARSPVGVPDARHARWSGRARVLVPAGVLLLAVVSGAAGMATTPDLGGPAPVAEAAASAVVAATWIVVDVVDGDTVDVRQGDLTERVRVIGIDTPERGECGYEQAADVLAGHVLGQDVVLIPGARDDHDRYGRALRYVDRASDGLDAGRSLLDTGLAVARYDSRDGYGGHPREGGYVAADAATADAAVCAPPTPPPTPPPPPPPPPAPAAAQPPGDIRVGCDPAYPTVCLAASPDVDCGEISFRYFPVLPPDPHRLDGSDEDGIACESG